MIQLKLDTQALNNLFPEGTQARMDLQAAVIKNVVDSVIGKRVTEEIENMVIKHVNLMMPANHEIEKIVHKEFADYIQKRYAYSNVFDINSGGIRQIKELISEHVKKQCNDLLDSIKLEAINDATKNLKADEEAFMARVTKNLEVTVRQEIVKRVNNEFPQIIDEAIKARLFPEAKG
ncbi:hypothetical protein GAP161_248 [Cronobacter phage vB_CsaM_GAP161]|uniref:Uncharacterized protein n=1 Tax=Cronobacter phage vB_CsaM_GAP161 TaxID=1141138 RepID=K4F7U3_9CAUD|nr:hypothetical protein GAP161_248 [Cronobacter phage vB_CsaM_GAP161]AFC22358.1 hypothetical protein GAP161_248 [Cronobacter phage vB_CsaM_GAP161]